MIKDGIENARLYRGISPRVAAALDFIVSGDLNSLTPGKYDIEGDNLYLMIQHNKLKPWNEGRWEAHREYADVLYLISGEESIGYSDKRTLESAQDYDPVRDIEFFNDADGARLNMRAGDFAVFFPNDAHRPTMLAPGASGDKFIDIAVFKVKL